jgi:hypothetical protein
LEFGHSWKLNSHLKFNLTLKITVTVSFEIEFLRFSLDGAKSQDEEIPKIIMTVINQQLICLAINESWIAHQVPHYEFHEYTIMSSIKE